MAPLFCALAITNPYDTDIFGANYVLLNQVFSIDNNSTVLKAHRIYMQKYFWLILLVVFFIAGCKKYPEGPSVSIRSKISRITGDYKVQLFSVNGVDSTSQLTCNTYSFDKTTVKKEIICCTGVGTWNMIGDDKIMDISIHFPNPQLVKTPFPVTFICCPVDNWATISSILRWEIQKLTNKEMWLKTTFAGKEYYIKFEKK